MRRRQDPVSLLAGFIAENRKVAVIVGVRFSFSKTKNKAMKLKISSRISSRLD
jgi:hypothetical protein